MHLKQYKYQPVTESNAVSFQLYNLICQRFLEYLILPKNGLFPI